MQSGRGIFCTSEGSAGREGVEYYSVMYDRAVRDERRLDISSRLFRTLS